MATDNKYDRQLRLWGAKGQKALSETTVVLIRATAAGTETLKNLVLPGVGRIVLVDDAHVQEEDAASNFFISYRSSKDSAPRGKVAMELLRELNPDVVGQYYDNNSVTSLMQINTTELLENIRKMNSGKILVVGADLEPPLLVKVSSSCVELKLPLIVVQSYGLIGMVRLQTPPLVLLDPKPDSEVPDLRLVTRFPQLSELADTISWNDLTSAEYGHIPYPLILMKHMDEWKESHGGQAPQNLQEKQDFQALLQKAGRKLDSNNNIVALNFQEASNMAYLAYTQRELPAERLDELLVTCQKHGLVQLQALLEALSKFVSAHGGMVPLSGTIPDMTASTDLYIQLQQVYQDKAKQDFDDMRRFLSNNVSDADLETFIKNVFSLDVLAPRRTIPQEYAFDNKPTDGCFDNMVDDWNMATFDPDDVPQHTPLLWYMALRACHVFYNRHGRHAGNNKDDYLLDVKELHSCIKEVATKMNLSENALVQETLLKNDSDNNNPYAVEMCRYANAEVHTIASVVGGVAAAEAVKIITGQYVPLDNTYIYNGIASTGGVYRF